MGERSGMGGLSLLGALGLLGCVTAGPATPPVAPPVAPATAQPAASADAGPTAEEESTALSRFFPGTDVAQTQRKRRPIAVLLFAPPTRPSADGALSSIETLRFQPVVCSIRGQLAVGARCGEVMPPRATVRLTEAGDAGRGELELERSTLPFRDEAGGQVYPAPYGPACCMYNTCVGRTVPYFPKRTQPDAAFMTTKTLLAVWPADAEIDLAPLAPGPAEDARVDDGPWARGERPARLIQSLLLHGRRYASIAQGNMNSGLFVDGGKGWQPLMRELGAREYYLLSTSDLDGNGRSELVVYARWANDYGLHVLAEDAPKQLYSFSCGNI
jgi:hypothetical protein